MNLFKSSFSVNCFCTSFLGKKAVLLFILSVFLFFAFKIPNSSKPKKEGLSTEKLLSCDLTINTPPTNQMICEGSEVSFNVGASSTAGGLTYQWRKICPSSAWTAYQHPNANFPPAQVNDVYVANGVIYVATFGGGLATLDVGNGATSWTVYNTSTGPSGFPSDFVYSVFYTDGVIYAATANGLATLNVGSGASSWTVYNTSTSSPSGFPHNSVTDVYVSNGIIYIATSGGGIGTLDIGNGATSWTVYMPIEAFPGFPDPNYNAVFELDGIIYASGSGLATLDIGNGASNWTIYTTSSGPSGFPTDYVYDTHVSEGIIHIGTPSGLATLDVANSATSWTVYSTSSGPSGFPADDVRSVYQADGIIYAGTFGGGLATLDIQNGATAWTVYNTSTSNPSGLLSDNIYAVLFSEGTIYAGTQGGLSTLNFYENIAGGNMATLTYMPSPGDENCNYQVVVKDGNDCEVISNAVSLSVITAPKIEPIEVQENTCPTGTVDLSMLMITDLNSVANTDTTFHSAIPTSATDMSNQLGSTIINSDQTVYVMLSNASTGCFDVAPIEVDVSACITTQPVDQTTCFGGDITYNVAATSTVGGLTYQWQESCTPISTAWTVYPGGGGGGDLPNNNVYDIYVSNGIIYAGTWNNGLGTLDIGNGATSWITYNTTTGPSNFPNNNVSSVYESNGVIYIGTFGGGIASLDFGNGASSWTVYYTFTGPSGFPDDNVWDIYTSNGVIYAATNNGVAILDEANGATNWTVYNTTVGLNGLPDNRVYGIYESDGVIYAATLDGLAALEVENGATSWTVYNTTTGPSGFPPNSVIAVYESNGVIYIATQTDLATLDVTNSATSWTIYNTSTGPSGFPSNNIKDVYESDGVIYAATFGGGIASLDIGNGANSWTVYNPTTQSPSGFPSYDVNAVYESDGVIYAGTWGGGVATLRHARSYENINGATSDTYTLTPQAGDEDCAYRALIMDNNGSEVISNAATFTFSPTPDIAAIPIQSNVCPVKTVDLSVLTIIDNNNVAGTDTTFHSAPPLSATDMSNQLVTTIISADQMIYVMLANTTTGCFDVASFEVDISICCDATISMHPTNQVTCFGEDVTFSASGTTTAGGLTYQWQKSCTPPATAWSVYNTSTMTPSGFPTNNVSSVYESNGVLYVGTDNGLATLDIENGATSWTVYNTTNGPSGYLDNSVTDVFESNGVIYVGTASGGLATLDIGNGATSWTIYSTFSGPSGLLDNFIYSVYESNGIIYLATGNGVATLDIGNDATSWTVYTTSIGPSGFPNNTVTDIYESEGVIYASTWGGLALLDVGSGATSWTVYSTSSGPSGLTDNSIQDMYIENGVIYVGVSFGVGILDVANGAANWTMNTYDFNNPNGFPPFLLRRIHVANGIIYAALNNGGLATLNFDKGETDWIVYNTSTANPSGFPGNDLNDVFELEGRIYVATLGNGLGVLDNSENFENIVGATMPTYTFTSQTGDEDCLFRVVVNDANNCEAVSEPACFTAYAVPDILLIPTQTNTCPEVSVDIFDLDIIDNNNVPNTVTTLHTALPTDANDMSNLLGSTVITADQTIYAMVADPNTGCFDVEPFLVDITIHLSINTQPPNLEICSDNAVFDLDVTSTEGGLTYQWQKGCTGPTDAWTVYNTSTGPSGFPNSFVTDAYETEGIIYLSTYAGVATLDVANNATSWTVYSTSSGPSGFPNDFVNAIYVADGIIYAATHGGGVATLDIGNSATSWTVYNTNTGPSGFPFDLVSDIYFADGIIYAASIAGLAVLDVGNSATSWMVYTSNTGPSGLPTDGVNKVLVHNGILYATTSDGLATLDIENGATSWTVYNTANGPSGLPDDNFYNIYVNDGIIYAVINGANIATLDVKDKSANWVIYNTLTGPSGFPNSLIWDIYAENGVIYAAAEGGLALLDVENGAASWTTYNSSTLNPSGFPTGNLTVLHGVNGKIYAGVGKNLATISVGPTYTDIPGATVSPYSYSIEPEDGDCVFRAIIMDGNGCTITSDEFSMVIYDAPDIAEIPKPCPDGSFDLSSLTITDNNNVAGTTTTFHSAIPTSATDMSNQLVSTIVTSNQIVYVMVASSSTGCYDVEPVDIDFGLCISNQPSDQTVCPEESTTFSVGATSAAGGLTYQWQKSCQDLLEWTVYNPFTGPSGFPNFFTYDVYESNGIIYAATSDGIGTLDVANGATSWTVYSTSTGPSGFPHNWVLSVYEHNGVLYAATYGGGIAMLDIGNGASSWTVYNTTTGPSGFPNDNVYKVLFDNGIIYAATEGGLATLDLNNPTSWTVYNASTASPSGFPSNSTFSVFIDEGILYVGTGNGLATLDIQNGASSWTVYNTTTGPSGIMINVIREVFVENGVIYIGTTGSVGILDIGNGATSWTSYNVSDIAGAFQSNGINDVYFSEGVLYAATNAVGLGLLDIENGATDWVAYNSYNGYPPGSPNNIQEIYVSNGIIYIATNSGIYTLQEFEDIPGATAADYTFSPTPADDSCLYRVIVMDGIGDEVKSIEAMLTLYDEPSIDKVLIQCNICPITSIDLTTVAINDTNNVAGTTTTFHSAVPTIATDMTNQLPSTTITSSQTVYAMVANTSTGCFDVTSFEVLIEPCCDLAFTSPPTDEFVCSGNDVTFNTTASTSATGLNYQWQKSCMPLPNWTVYSDTTSSPSGLLDYHINSVVVLDEVIYVTTENAGLATLDVGNGATSWTTYTTTNGPSGLPDNTVQDIFISEGVIYVTPRGKGLASLDVANSATSWTTYSYDPNGPVGGLPTNSISDIFVDKGVIYLTTNAGLATLDVANGATDWKTYTFQTQNPSGLPTNSLSCLHVSDGVVYVGTVGGGIATLDIGNNATSWTVYNTTTGPSGLLDNTILDIYYDNGVLYAATNVYGVATLDIANNATSWTTYNSSTVSPSGYPSMNNSNRVYSVHASNGVIYIGTEGGGLATLDVGNNATSWTVYNVNTTNPDGLPTNWVIDVFESNGVIYGATSSGGLATLRVYEDLLGATSASYSFTPQLGDENCTYRVIAADNNGCEIVSNTVSFSYDVVPDIATIPTQSNPCGSETLNLNDINVIDNNNVAGTTKTFHSAIPSSATDMNNQLSSTIVSTDQTVYVMIANLASGCFDVESFMVDIFTSVAITPPTNTTTCTGGDITFSVNTTSTATGLTYQWQKSCVPEPMAWSNYTTTSTPSGFPNDNVWHIHISDGVIYAATENGVAILDEANGATNWTVYNTPFIPNNLVYSIYEADGIVYATTFNGGVSTLDYANGASTWVTYNTNTGPSGFPTNQTQSVYVDEGVIYVATYSGLATLDVGNGATNWTVYNTTTGPSGFPDDTVWDVLVMDGVIYVATQGGGVGALDVEGGATSWTVYNTATIAPSGFPHNNVNKLHADNGILYAATQGGLATLDVRNNATSWTVYNSTTGPTGFPNFAAQDVYVENGMIYVGIWGYGVAVLDVRNDATNWEIYNSFALSPSNYPQNGNNVSTIQVSNETIYVATYGGGIGKLDLSKTYMDIDGETSDSYNFIGQPGDEDCTYRVVIEDANNCQVTSDFPYPDLSICCDLSVTNPTSDKEVCLGDPVTFNVGATSSEGGLTYQWQKSDYAWMYYNNFTEGSNGFPLSNTVVDVTVSEGILYASTTAGLATLDIGNGASNWTVYNSTSGPSGFPNDYLVDISVSDGIILGAVQFGGIITLDIGNGATSWTAYSTAIGPTGFPSNDVREVVYENGVIYAATISGVAVLDIGNGATSWTVYPVMDQSSQRPPNSIYVENGVVYVGTNPGGLATLDVGNGATNWTFYTSTSGNGFPSTVVNDVYGSNGVIYASTNRGLATLDVANGATKWIVYDEDTGSNPGLNDGPSGLPGNDIGNVFVLNEVIYAMTNTGLAVLDKGNGAESWIVYSYGSNNPSGLIANHTGDIFVHDGIIYIAGLIGQNNGLAYLDTSNEGFMDINGATNNTYSFTPQFSDTVYSYRVLITDAVGCEIYGDTVSLDVYQTPDIAPILPQMNTCPSDSFDLNTLVVFDNQQVSGAIKTFHNAMPSNASDMSNQLSSTIIKASQTVFVMLKHPEGDCFDVESFMVEITICNPCNTAQLVVENTPSNNNTIVEGTYKAGMTITSAGTVAANDEVIFQPAVSVTLTPGFHAKAGSDFIARIAPCPPSLLVNESRSDESSERVSEVIESPSIKAFPNPTSYESNIVLTLPHAQAVQLDLFDINGRKMANLANGGILSEGTHHFTWNCSNFQPGMYFLVFNGKVESKLVVIGSR